MIDVEQGLPVEGRQCGECSMCCKLMEICELSKPAGIWCQQVIKKGGCSIYDERPPSCRSFGCGYLHWPMTGDHWLPSKCKMVIVAEDDSRLAIHVDPSTPNVWRAEPYYSDLKYWAQMGSADPMRQIVVSVGRKMTVILPDSDVYLGFLTDEEVILSGQRADGSYSAEKRLADDPTLAGLPYGKEMRIPAKKASSLL